MPLLLPPLRALPALHLLQKKDLKMGDAEVDREHPVVTVWRSVSYVDRILKGANPSEVPAQQLSKFEIGD